VGFEAAVAAFEGMGDRLGAGSALVSLAGVLWNLGDPAASRTRLTDAIALLEREPPGPQLAHAYAELAAHRLDAGSFEEGAIWAQRSLSLAEEGDAVEQRLRALGYRGVARCSLGEAAGLDDLRAALRLALDAGLAYHAGQWYANLGNSLGDFDPSAGLAAFREGIQFAERRGLTELAMWMRGERWSACSRSAGGTTSSTRPRKSARGTGPTARRASSSSPPTSRRPPTSSWSGPCW
jgi:tetratricopeptide (TPR) repeat protein